MQVPTVLCIQYVAHCIPGTLLNCCCKFTLHYEITEWYSATELCAAKRKRAEKKKVCKIEMLCACACNTIATETATVYTINKWNE